MGNWVKCKSATDPDGVVYVNLDQAIAIAATSAGTEITYAASRNVCSEGEGGKRSHADVTSRGSSDPSIIVDPGMASALLAGRKTQVRVGARSVLSQSVPGDRLWVRESCIAGRREAGQDYATMLNKAEFAIFADGWRRYRDGSGQPGRQPGDDDYMWIGATHMPRWASRMTLVVEWTRAERLQQITRADIRAEGALPILGGLLWRWPRPIPGRRLTARRAFAANWNVNHPTPGDRWEDNPPVVVLGFRVESGDPSASAQAQRPLG